MSEVNPWFILAGGGTGGHLYPGIAVMQALQVWEKDVDVTIFGTNRDIDERIVKTTPFELFKQDVRPFPRRPWQAPGFWLAWRRSVKIATRLFEHRRPVVVLGLGGYAAGPPIVAASKMGIRTAIFNPDAVPGRANQWLSSRVDRVFVQWERTGEHFPRAKDVHCTGCPIRPDFITADRDRAMQQLRLDPAKRTLLVTGASQGAHSLNLTVLELMDMWKANPEWQILHLTGEADLELCRKAYKESKIDARTTPYTEHMAMCMAAADLVISRAGASTLAEITAMRVASILLPYPFDRKKHQLANAKILASAGASEIIEDKNDPEANALKMRRILTPLLRSDQFRQRMARSAAVLGRINAADSIANDLMEMAGMAELD